MHGYVPVDLDRVGSPGDEIWVGTASRTPENVRDGICADRRWAAPDVEQYGEAIGRSVERGKFLGPR
jgi:hypothetical protein